MSHPGVVYLQPRSRPDAAPESPRVIAAFGAALLQTPPKPQGLAACVAYLQEDAVVLRTRQMGMRALQNLRASVFLAPGRDREMALLWREALATACYARVIAAHSGFDAPLLTGVGLLHRAGEIAALRALAQAECETGQRLLGPVMQQIIDARDDELVARVTRGWSLPGEQRLLILRWRGDQDLAQRPQSVSLLVMAQALATELAHATVPGLVEAARESLRLPQELVERARAATAGIAGLLGHLAPQETATA